MPLHSPGIFVALALCALSCTQETPAPAAPVTTTAPATSAAVREDLESDEIAVSPGSIEGLILFEGTPPARTPINTAAEGGCGLDPSEPALTETWVVEHGRMANVFVWIANPPTDPSDTAVAREPIVLHQRGCVYRPHAVALRVGQTLRVTNEDRARHNVHAVSRRDENPNINQSQEAGGAALDLVFGSFEVGAPIVCDLHPWMKAWVGAFDHRFFAVTGADGRFGWSGLPPGEYEVRAWHEALGRVFEKTVVTKESGARVRITFKKKD